MIRRRKITIAIRLKRKLPARPSDEYAHNSGAGYVQTFGLKSTRSATFD